MHADAGPTGAVASTPWWLVLLEVATRAVVADISAIVGAFWLRARQHGRARAPEPPLAPAA